MRTHSPPTRRGYLDWLRGLAVLIMIETHVLDSWTRLDHRDSVIYSWSMIAGGMGAPLFLFLAGVSVALSAGSKARRLGDDGAAAAVVVKRGLQIFGLAFLFRLQATIVSWGSWRSLLKVDILNIMGPGIMGAAALWGAVRTKRARLAAFALATCIIAALTPLVRAAEWPAILPEPLEAYLRPKAGLTSFLLFPWTGFVFAGTFVGILLDATRTDIAEREANMRLFLGGLLLAGAAFGASFVPSILANSHFWTTSPSFFLLRVGLMTLAVAVAYAWDCRKGGERRWSPLKQLGRTSLFVYWIHVELVYGLVVRPLHKSMTLSEAWFGVLLFVVLMLILSLLWEGIRTRRSSSGTGGGVTVPVPKVVL